MAIFAATDVVVTINSVDYSDWCTSVELPLSAADLPTTAFGDTWDDRIGGLKSGTITINFNQDFVDNGIDESIYGLLGTVVACTVKPTSAAISTANPEYQFSVLVTEWSPISASVGALATVSVTWPLSGAVTRDVTP